MLKRGELYNTKLCFELWTNRPDLNCRVLKQEAQFIVLDVKIDLESTLKLTYFIILTSQGTFRTSSWINVANFERCIERVAQW